MPFHFFSFVEAWGGQKWKFPFDSEIDENFTNERIQQKYHIWTFGVDNDYYFIFFFPFNGIGSKMKNVLCDKLCRFLGTVFAVLASPFYVFFFHSEKWRLKIFITSKKKRKQILFFNNRIANVPFKLLCEWTCVLRFFGFRKKSSFAQMDGKKEKETTERIKRGMEKLSSDVNASSIYFIRYYYSNIQNARCHCFLWFSCSHVSANV